MIRKLIVNAAGDGSLSSFVPRFYSNMEGQNFVQCGKKIVAAAMNYKSMVLEKKMPMPTTPIMFLKPTSSYIVEGQTIEVPKEFDVYEEVELGVIIGRRGKNIKPAEVMDYIAGYCLALDLTAVDDMKNSREKGLPWTFGKGFDTACPVSRFISKCEIEDPTKLQIWCKVNDKLLQDGVLSDMVFSIEEMVSYTSKYMTLEPNDLLLTGSPGNNGPIRPGDVVEAGLKGIMTMKFPVISMKNC